MKFSSIGGPSIVIIIALALTGCQTNNNMGNQLFGAVAGAVLGSFIGQGSGRTAAIVGGAFLGSQLNDRPYHRSQYYPRQYSR